MKNFGILLRGKSLEKSDQIFGKFNDCMIVNNFKVEIEKYAKYFKNKNIIHFVNAMPSASLEKPQYQKFNIKKIQFSFTKKYRENKHSDQRIGGIIKYYNQMNIGLKLEYCPDKLYNGIFNIHNTGVACILYISECLKPENIWIAGLDFYQSNYLIKKTTDKQRDKSQKIDMIGSFIKIINDHPNINYNLISYYKKFPKLKNLNLIE